MTPIIIEKMTVAAWPDVSRIYGQGIASRNATFEMCVPEWEDWDAIHRKDCRIIALIDGKIVGWAALTSVSGRCVYEGVAEVSIYVDENFREITVGDHLMKSLIKESEAIGIWTLQAGLFMENCASYGLHKKNGFRVIGVKEKVGKMNGVWRDVALLERRSEVVGVQNSKDAPACGCGKAHGEKLFFIR